MKYWALLVAFLYFLILVALTWPVGSLAFLHKSGVNISDVFSSWFYWGAIGSMVVSQGALLTVPVKIASRRPVTHRSLIPSLIASGLMISALVLGVFLCFYECFITESWPEGLDLLILKVGVLIWLLWFGLFYRLSRNQNPQDIISKQCRYLLRGSILELLIAVPTHILVRSRDECCAGFMTFFGLAMGISVMLFSFGPGIFFLFVDRWKKLNPKKKSS